MSTHQNLGDLSNSLCNALAASGELNIIETSHFAAVYAKEMWMPRIFSMMIVSDGFKPPDVIPQLGTSQ